MDENLLKITREIFKNVEQNENLDALIFFFLFYAKIYKGKDSILLGKIFKINMCNFLKNFWSLQNVMLFKKKCTSNFWC
jgi:hypothetical protein